MLKDKRSAVVSLRGYRRCLLIKNIQVCPEALCPMGNSRSRKCCEYYPPSVLNVFHTADKTLSLDIVVKFGRECTASPRSLPFRLLVFRGKFVFLKQTLWREKAQGV